MQTRRRRQIEDDVEAQTTTIRRRDVDDGRRYRDNYKTYEIFLSSNCNIPGPAQKETQVQEAQGEETLDITPSIAYKRRSFPRVQPQERQQAKPCLSRTPPPPPPQAAAAPSPAKPAASRPRSPSRRNRAPSRRLLDSVSCKQLRSEP
ncbi:hypothetical protein DY000_02040134 [Brassica cretica]|uniref:Uncharacterized protein n=1 Tax=Brassica cretica TaxID=69181 RepID=A0ABQ7BAW9_BRACR|nr:hypothetical protein DY000_02040134 [Brassica cretica]